MVWFVIILMLLVVICLVLALKFLVFKPSEAEIEPENRAKRVVNLLTLRIVFTAILLALSYLYLSSI
jgi:small-conductance mechanosensitive channel